MTNPLKPAVIHTFNAFRRSLQGLAAARAGVPPRAIIGNDGTTPGRAQSV